MIDDDERIRRLNYLLDTAPGATITRIAAAGAAWAAFAEQVRLAILPVVEALNTWAANLPPDLQAALDRIERRNRRRDRYNAKMRARHSRRHK